MISTGILLKENQVLMVRQLTKRGTVIWNFPGGGVEEGETVEEACVREMKEETGYDVKIRSLLIVTEKRAVFLCEIIGGSEGYDKNDPANEDLLELKWVSLFDDAYFDEKLEPIRERIKEKMS